jgi:hypothetical protein
VKSFVTGIAIDGVVEIQDQRSAKCPHHAEGDARIKVGREYQHRFWGLRREHLKTLNKTPWENDSLTAPTKFPERF